MFILLIVIVHCITAELLPVISNERLPGLDELESGYSVATMQSKLDAQSKFRILDLSGKSPSPYRFMVGKIDRMYDTPLLAQVRKLAIRREIIAESIINNYNHFYSK